MELLKDNTLSLGLKLQNIYQFKGKIIPNITIQITDDCCCACSYCYEIDKAIHYMTKETADKVIQQIFDLYELDDKNIIVNKSVLGICIDFIGGEPLMNMPIVSHITKTILNKCILENHPWLDYLRFHLTTNGVLYFTPEVQEYIKLYEPFLDITISIDGPQHVHDLNRILLNQKGTFEKAYKALKDWQSRGHFVVGRPTVSPNTLPYLFDIVKFFLDNDITKITCAFVQEHQWTMEEAKICYEQKKKIADYILANNIDFTYLGNLFFPYRSDKILEEILNNQHMEALGCLDTLRITYTPDGSIYPCTRVSPSSLKELSTPFKFQDGKDFQLHYEVWEKLSKEKKVNPIECENCHLRVWCPLCLGPSSEEGDYHLRSKSRCTLNKVTELASSYFYNQYYKQNNLNEHYFVRLPETECLKYVSLEEYKMLKKMEED